ncbi:MAG: DinB family protein, partial [Bryobacteraceae bacterium]
MKLLPPILVIAYLFPLAFVAESSMTALERQRLAAHLEMTGAWLPDEVSDLSPAQLQFRPAPGRWSIIEVLEHLTISSPIYWTQLHETMKKLPERSRTAGTDEGILWYGIDRTRREKAIPSEDVKGRLRDVSAALKALRALHEEMLRYARTTNDDLRAHFVERQGSDAYQWFLLISTHEQRHILQIREIKGH